MNENFLSLEAALSVERELLAEIIKGIEINDRYQIQEETDPRRRDWAVQYCQESNVRLAKVAKIQEAYEARATIQILKWRGSNKLNDLTKMDLATTEHPYKRPPTSNQSKQSCSHP
eukprot:TRINITY_DN3383_c0_g1_i1.p1 TRINITY_DN3383_c0_g1~~TRINITY_DN3383_c0_g1_i1.p1  ORF type:complete len:116 (-),score=11.55 TRINITY_DN3383_c0_g1_i1:134-481(-)